MQNIKQLKFSVDSLEKKLTQQYQNFSESLVGKVKKSFIITMMPHMQKDTKQKAKIVSFMPSCNWIMKKNNFLKIICLFITY